MFVKKKSHFEISLGGLGGCFQLQGTRYRQLSFTKQDHTSYLPPISPVFWVYSASIKWPSSLALYLVEQNKLRRAVPEKVFKQLKLPLVP